MKIGDTVTLNDYGLNMIYGTTLGLKSMKQIKMKITDIDWTLGDGTWGSVEVDNPDITQFALTTHDFDEVT